MILQKILFALFILTGVNCISQSDETLFSIDSEPVKVSEFERVFNKNLNIVSDENQKDVTNYLELYINYKLKVKQAQDLGLDTIASYKKELNSYKKQIMAPYLRDDAFIDKLVKEAYDRSLIEINASHILIKVDKKSKDTITAYAKIEEARAKITNGEKFEDIAIAYSDDGSARTNQGNLGYFSVFDMVYPFENAIYKTEVGEISKVFRTRFGYHIVYIHDVREAKGEVSAAHIMIKHDSISGRNHIDELYANLQNGQDFESLAKNYSDDKYTGEKGGDLGRFGSGKMVKEFEDTVFSLKNIGDYSKPFKTQYGWHIVKLTHKFPIESFEKQEKELTSKVKRGDRASIVSNSIVFKIRDNYTIEVNEKALDLVKSGSVISANDLKMELMTLEGASVSIERLVKYLSGSAYTNSLFEKFKNDQIMEYYKLHLEETNQEYAYTFQEYKEGLLLFELMQERIWEKSNDSIGIKTYFDSHKINYKKEGTADIELSEVRGQVLNDYQEYLEKLWIEELHKTYTVKINDEVLEKIAESLNEK